MVASGAGSTLLGTGARVGVGARTGVPDDDFLWWEHSKRMGSFGESSGAVYVYERTGISQDQWRQTAKLLPSDGDELDRFGHAVQARRSAERRPPRGCCCCFTARRATNLEEARLPLRCWSSDLGRHAVSSGEQAACQAVCVCAYSVTRHRRRSRGGGAAAVLILSRGGSVCV